MEFPTFPPQEAWRKAIRGYGFAGEFVTRTSGDMHLLVYVSMIEGSWFHIAYAVAEAACAHVLFSGTCACVPVKTFLDEACL